MAGNKNLKDAMKAKKDEFYTQMQDIANELRHYAPHFKGKTVFCNCDDPYESNFTKYFYMKFNELGLKKLICTSYKGSPIEQTELRFGDDQKNETGKVEKQAHKFVVTGATDWNGDGAVDLEDFKVELMMYKPDPLKGNLKYGAGDFRSPECIELLKEADIVVTNPPFSLFREYVAQLYKYNKKFLIIGNQNSIACKEIFPLIKENKMWLGFGFKGGAAHFISHYEDVATAGDHKEGMIRVSGVVWYTNLDHNKRHDPIDLYKHYTPEEYPKYDNYDAIEVNKTADIPCDYDGVMGVPVTFLDKYCPEQFEIIWQASGNTYANAPREILDELKFNPNIKYGGGLGAAIVKGKPTYTRILIRKIK